MKINFKKLSRTKSTTKPQSHFFTNPYKLWSLFLSLAFILAICLGLFSYILFRKVATDSIGQENTSSAKPAELINHDKLNAVLSSFDEKQKVFSDAEASLPNIADPSK